MKLKSLTLSVLTFFVIWVLLNNSLSGEVVMMGAILSVAIALIFCKACNLFNDIKLNPRALWHWFLFFIVFLFELVKANLDVARRVISPKLPINPGIVEVKTKLTSQLGRMILANSITLTPGTFTVELSGDRIFIHWIDVKGKNIEEATDLIVRKFEKHLEVIYG
ncbi:MAG: Na+/H+ antiporter subunit E [Bacteroidetes bacterium]|nr:Na+/H+ antiporter subunit E [Bacteroidota bacterium]